MKCFSESTNDQRITVIINKLPERRMELLKWFLISHINDIRENIGHICIGYISYEEFINALNEYYL